jgi:hypothetical protein
MKLNDDKVHPAQKKDNDEIMRDSTPTLIPKEEIREYSKRIRR